MHIKTAISLKRFPPAIGKHTTCPSVEDQQSTGVEPLSQYGFLELEENTLYVGKL